MGKISGSNFITLDRMNLVKKNLLQQMKEHNQQLALHTHDHALNLEKRAKEVSKRLN